MEFHGYKRCSTCRKAHKFLVDHGIDVAFHDFVADPPTADELRSWIQKRGEGVQPFINTKGTRYRELGLADKKLTDEQWVELLSQDGKLIKRPVLVFEEQVVVGFNSDEYERVLGAS